MTELPVRLPVKAYDEASVFEPVNLLREARRQNDLPDVPAPRVCLLDPDGDIAAHLESSGQGHRHPGWACYHTDMWVTGVSGTTIGVVGRAVGAPFAALILLCQFGGVCDEDGEESAGEVARDAADDVTV